MKYENLVSFSDEAFEQLVGVSKAAFIAMVEVLIQFEQQKKKSGRPHTLSIENQLLLTLKYLIHERTQLQLADEYNLAESNANRTIRKVEQALAQSKQVCLPLRKVIKRVESEQTEVLGYSD